MRSKTKHYIQITFGYSIILSGIWFGWRILPGPVKSLVLGPVRMSLQGWARFIDILLRITE